MGQQEREREKINRPEHAAGRSQSKGTEQVQRSQPAAGRPNPAPPEAAGGERGGLRPKDRTPTALQTGLQSLIKDLLRFWTVVARHRAQAPDRRGRGLGLGMRRAEGAPHRPQGECARQAPGCLSRSDGEDAKRRRSFLFRAFVEHPRAGTARSAGHAPYRTAGSLSSVEGKAAPAPTRSTMELAT